MKVVVENIYSEEGRQQLAQAYIKAFWSDRVYHKVRWCGVPLLQTPEDAVLLAEAAWATRPKLIVECGIWGGGGLILYSSILSLLWGADGEVVGVDVNISQAKPAVDAHPLGRRVTLLEGSSTAPEIVRTVSERASKADSVMVVLDSNHTKNHVRAELEAYAPLIRPGGYLVAMDGIMNILHDVPGGHPSWREDNPESAVADFLKTHPEFERDFSMSRLGMTYAPGGFLKRRP